MKEQEWLASADPERMLRGLMNGMRDHAIDPFINCGPDNHKPSARKLRLFACACCRAIQDGAPCPRCNGAGRLRPLDLEDEEPDVDCASCGGAGRVGGLDPRSRRAVEVTEHYADGEATAEELEETYVEQYHTWDRTVPGSTEELLMALVCCVVRVSGDDRFGSEVLLAASERVGISPSTQAALIRDVFGNPFCPGERICPTCDGDGTVNEADDLVVPCPTCCTDDDDPRMGGLLPRIDPACLGWNGGTVPALARAIYEERRWGDMPVLADALLDAGCDDDELIQHCNEFVPRDGKRVKAPPHCRGCWALDLILGLS